MALSGTTPNLSQIDAGGLDGTERARHRDVLVLLSGGQDSTTALFWARRQFPTAAVHCLTISYGQRHESEVGAAAHIAGLAGAETHDFADLSDALSMAQSALVSRDIALTSSGGFADDQMPEGLPSSFVPGRNLVFLAVAAAYAARYRCQAIVLGVCQTDYSGYPDCRVDFIRKAAAAIRASLPTELSDIELYTPLMNLTKAQTVHLAMDIARTTTTDLIGDLPHPILHRAWDALRLTVTCYLGRRPGCGKCPACVLRAKGFEEAGYVDPVDFDTAQAATPRGPESGWEARMVEESKAAAAEVRAFDHPESVLKVTSVEVEPGTSINVIARGDAIELRPDTQHGTAREFTLRQAADALERAGYDAGVAKFGALDIRNDIRPDRGLTQVEVGSRTIELSEKDMREIADLSMAAEDPALLPYSSETGPEWQVPRPEGGGSSGGKTGGGKTGGVHREMVKPLDNEADHSMGTGKSEFCEVPR